MALKKVERKPLKQAGGLKKMGDGGGIAQRRLINSALDFVPDEDDVIGDLPEDLSHEQAHLERMARLEAAMAPDQAATGNPSSMMKADLNRQRAAHDSQKMADYYCVVCFADGDAVSEFLRKVKYPDPDVTFVDGHVLASLLNIELPKPKFRLQKIRPPQKTLARLVTEFPKKA